MKVYVNLLNSFFIFFFMGSKFKSSEISEVLKLYRPCDRNSVEAARRFKQKYNRSISAQTIINYWKKEDYEINSHGGKRIALYGERGALTDEEIQEVIEAYDKYQGSVAWAANELPYSIPTFTKYWGLHGLEIKNPYKIHKRRKLEEKTIDDVLES